MGGATVMPVTRDVFSQQVADTTQWADTINWVLRCGWLQVASTHNTMLMRAAKLAGLVASFILVVIGALHMILVTLLSMLGFLDFSFSS